MRTHENHYSHRIIVFHRNVIHSFQVITRYQASDAHGSLFYRALCPPPLSCPLSSVLCPLFRTISDEVLMVRITISQSTISQGTHFPTCHFVKNYFVKISSTSFKVPFRKVPFRKVPFGVVSPCFVSQITVTPPPPLPHSPTPPNDKPNAFKSGFLLLLIRPLQHGKLLCHDNIHATKAVAKIKPEKKIQV